MRTAILIGIILLFSINYSVYLYCMANILFWQETTIRIWIYSMFAFLVIPMLIMGIGGQKSSLERNVYCVGIGYISLIFFIIILHYSGYFITTNQFRLFIINGLTFAYLLMVFISAKRHGLLKNDE